VNCSLTSDVGDSKLHVFHLSWYGLLSLSRFDAHDAEYNYFPQFGETVMSRMFIVNLLYTILLSISKATWLKAVRIFGTWCSMESIRIELNRAVTVVNFSQLFSMKSLVPYIGFYFRQAKTILQS